MTGVKKTHWLRNTLIVLIICGIAGTALAAVQFSKDGGRTYASSSLQFSFDGAADGKAPNGYPFDVSGLTSDEVLEAALEASGLTGTYTADQIRENMNVTGVFPEKIAEQMTKYVSLLDADASIQAAVSDYHATQYSVVLYNDFDKGISSDKLSELLGNIMTAFRQQFSRTAAPSLGNTNPISDLQEYDYAQQLEAVGESVTQLKRYAAEMAEMVPDFMVAQKGFGDIEVRYENLQSDIDRLNATITLNAVSRDRDRLQKRYEMEIRSQKIQLESLNEELKLIEAQVNAYEKQGIIYVSDNGSLQAVGSAGSQTYDKLVEERKKVTDTIAETNARIALYQAMLDDMTQAVSKTRTAASEEGETSDAAEVEQLTEEELAALSETVETRINALNKKKDIVSAAFSSMLDAYTAQEINENTVSASAVKYIAPSYLSGAFVMKALKTAGPFCAVGFMICLVLLIISRMRQEKKA